MVEVTTRQIGKWYKETFDSLDRSISLKERRKMAEEIVARRIEEYKRIIPLGTFF